MDFIKFNARVSSKMERVLLHVLLIQSVLLGQFHHQAYSYTTTYNKRISDVGQSIKERTDTSDIHNLATVVHKRVTRAENGGDAPGFTFQYYRNIPGIGYYKISTNNARGWGFTIGRGNNQAARTFMNRMNEGMQTLQTWTKTFSDLAQVATTNRNNNSGHGGFQQSWQVSWKTGR